MRRILVAGNWKMHGTQAMVDTLMNGIAEGIKEMPAVDVAVFPPFPFLGQVQRLALGTAIEWGGQTLNPNESGAYTGEVSAAMLMEFGCQHVLVGHSERRTLYGESNDDVAQRFAAAQAAGLAPVLCVGETLEQREQGITNEVVAAQLDAILSTSGIEAMRNATVAYEPVWAIGTGLTASPEQAQAVHAFIRDKLTALDGTIGGLVRILYGGSVKPSNAAELFAREDIDGALVGGASLTVGDFVGICQGVS